MAAYVQFSDLTMSRRTIISAGRHVVPLIVGNGHGRLGQGRLPSVPLSDGPGTDSRRSGLSEWAAGLSVDVCYVISDVKVGQT